MRQTKPYWVYCEIALDEHCWPAARHLATPLMVARVSPAGQFLLVTPALLLCDEVPEPALAALGWVGAAGEAAVFLLPTAAGREHDGQRQREQGGGGSGGEHDSPGARRPGRTNVTVRQQQGEGPSSSDGQQA